MGVFMTRKIKIFTAFLLSLGWLFIYPAQASPSYYTLSEYNSALESARSAVDSATAEVAYAQAAVNASAVYHETSTVTGQVNVVVNGTFDNASAWSNIGMGSQDTILNSNIARVYNGVLVGSYTYGFILQTGTFSSPTRQFTFSYDMSNNNNNDGNRPQADGYRVEFRTYNSAGQRLNYYDTRDRADSFAWRNFSTTYTLSDDAVRWDIGFRLIDNGYWNGNFAGSIDNVSLVTNTTSVRPAYTSYDPALVTALQQKQAELQAAQSVLSSLPALTINSPTNLVASVESGTVALDWDAPTSGLIPERYAISWTIPGNAGWGIATGNAGDSNALNTSITINPEVFATSGGWDKNYTFYIRSDHDTARMYSTSSNQVTVYLADPTPPVIVIVPSETNTATTPNETATVTYPTPSETTTVTTPTGPTAEEIAAQVAAQLSAQQAEAARIQAETAALIAQQAAAAQAEANRLAEIAAANAEANRIAAELAAKVAAEETAMAEEAARIQAEIDANAEADRIAAELEAAQAQMEAEAQAEADRIAQEEADAQAKADAQAEADRIAAEQEAMEQEIENAKAEEEAAIAEEKAEIAEELAAIAEKEKFIDNIKKDVESGKELTEEQKDVVIAALIEDLKPGESISAAEVKASGVSYADLPADTPIEVRTSESGEVLVITAEVAANIELVQDPGALLEAVFTDPGAALAALGSIGADMTESEREEATDMVVATVVATGAAINAAAVAAGGAAGGSGGGGSSGGGSGSNSPGSRGGRRW